MEESRLRREVVAARREHTLGAERWAARRAAGSRAAPAGALPPMLSLAASSPGNLFMFIYLNSSFSSNTASQSGEPRFKSQARTSFL